MWSFNNLYLSEILIAFIKMEPPTYFLIVQTEESACQCRRCRRRRFDIWVRKILSESICCKKFLMESNLYLIFCKLCILYISLLNWYTYKLIIDLDLYIYVHIWASLVVQRLKRMPAMWETWVSSLGWEDPLEKEMATLSSILAWRIPWTEEPGGLQSTGSQRVGHD